MNRLQIPEEGGDYTFWHNQGKEESPVFRRKIKRSRLFHNLLFNKELCLHVIFIRPMNTRNYR
jgi:hypothetical protein